MKSSVVAIFACIIFSTSINGQEAKVFKLQTAIDVAIANNILVRQSETQVDWAKTSYKQSRYNRLPMITGDLSYGINNGRSIDPFTNSYNNQRLWASNGGITAILPVFRGFQNQHAIKQNRYLYNAEQLESRQEKDNLVLNVILAFLQVLNNEDVLTLAIKQGDVSQKQVERLTILNNEGAISPALLSDLQGQYAAEQVSIVNAKNDLESSKLTLTQLMNISYDEQIKLDRTGFDSTLHPHPVSPAQVFDSAQQKLSMVKAADMRVKAAMSGVKVAAAGFYPTLSFVGQLNSNYSSAARIFTPTNVSNVPSGDYVVVGTDNVPVMTSKTDYSNKKITYLNQLDNNLNTYFGISLQVPIFSAFRNKTNVSLARIETKNANLLAEDTRVKLRQAIDQAFLDLNAAKEKLKLLQEQVSAFNESFRAAEIKFEAGVINSVEYLVVKNNLDRANINLTVARYEYLLRSRVLDFYQGK